MPSLLSFSTISIPCGGLGKESMLADMIPGSIVQNKTKFALSEYDEIYEGYGKMATHYPYTKYLEYHRELTLKEVKTATLENEYLKAVFLPDFGGRLWKLYDKVNQKDILYTNDVLRASNLAVRNAWFSGGVEWNIGVIGHTPLTMDTVFVAREITSDKEAALRMYAYERIRGVVYQMDFWLAKEEPVLYTRMRIANETDEVIPMYWWSNIAVPEYKNGRIFVPAKEAYSCKDDIVKKVSIPCDDGVDITYHDNISEQIDYFFDIPTDAPKYIVAVDENGCGLCHASTKRLRSRKLFSWGHSKGADRWQEFLTQDAGRYLEIQAGLGKTQYGCIPMAPNSTWEWMERYSPIHLSCEQMKSDFDTANSDIAKFISKFDLETKLVSTREWAMEPAEKIIEGNGDAFLVNMVRKERGLRILSPHLDFASRDNRTLPFVELLKTNRFKNHSEDIYYLNEPWWINALKEAWKKEEESKQYKDKWEIAYHLSILYYLYEDKCKGMCWVKRSIDAKKTVYNCHLFACYYYLDNQYQEAKKYLLESLELAQDNLSIWKEALTMLFSMEEYSTIIHLVGESPEAIKDNSRIQFTLARALAETGKMKEAKEILENNGGLEVEDIQECDKSINNLWTKLNETNEDQQILEVPHFFQF